MADLIHNIGGTKQSIRPSLSPDLQIVGAENVGVVLNSEYQDLGATTSNRYGYETASDVDTTTIGQYQVTYTATDLVGRTNTATRNVHVVQDDNIQNYEQLIQLNDSFLPTTTIVQDIDATQLQTQVLTGDVDPSSRGWQPLGTESEPRVITLNGTSKTLTNFYINLKRASTDSSGTFVTANFISHGADVHISDLSMSNMIILSENRRSGALVGRTHGPVHVHGMTIQGVVSAQHVNAWDTGGVIGEIKHPVTVTDTNIDINQRSGRFGSGLMSGVVRANAGDHLFENVVIHGTNDVSVWNQSYMGGAGWHGGVSNSGFIGSVATGNTVTLKNFTMFVDVIHYRGPYGGSGGVLFSSFNGEQLFLENVNINGAIDVQSGTGNPASDGTVFGNFGETTIHIKNLSVNDVPVTAANFHEYAGNISNTTLIDVT